LIVEVLSPNAKFRFLNQDEALAKITHEDGLVVIQGQNFDVKSTVKQSL
jgi:hypothetical protein